MDDLRGIKDSISDKEKKELYITAGGDTVYGGGGIMPDIYVPVDTQNITDLFTESVNKGLLYRFAFRYTDKNRKLLSAYSDVKSLEKYLDSQNLWAEYEVFAKAEGLKWNPAQAALSSKLMQVHIKAFISRNILNDQGFYPIALKVDKTYLRALQHLSKK
jgi:carboxyl-terminal processing protease